MTVIVQINSNNPLVAGTYTAADQPTMLTMLIPVIALVDSIVPQTVDDAVRILTINGHVAFLNFQ